MSVTSLIAGTLMLATSAEATLISNPDIFCLSHAIYWETRGVEAQGASMVGEVVLNRVMVKVYTDGFGRPGFHVRLHGADAPYTDANARVRAEI